MKQYSLYLDENIIEKISNIEMKNERSRSYIINQILNKYLEERTNEK